MRLIIILIAIVFIQCGSLQENAEATSIHKLDCEYLGGAKEFYRCVNDEVVCYSNKDGLSCLIN